MQIDVVIVGGSFAGLSAAIYLGRARRTVAVLDTGMPRNRFARHSHGFFAQDGANPLDMLATMRAQVAAYPTVSFIDQAAVDVAGAIDGFTVTLADGSTITARRIVLAFGLRDTLPEIAGLAQYWGNSVIVCPYCHGFEFSDRPLGVLRGSPFSVHHAMLVPQWGPTTYFLDGAEPPTPEEAAELANRNVTVVPGRVKAVEGDGDALQALVLEDGTRHPLAALFIAPKSDFSSDLVDRLGCATENGMASRVITTDPMQKTSVAGVFAAGDIARPAASIAFAVADGVMAGTAAHRTLVFPG